MKVNFSQDSISGIRYDFEVDDRHTSEFLDTYKKQLEVIEKVVALAEKLLPMIQPAVEIFVEKTRMQMSHWSRNQ